MQNRRQIIRGALSGLSIRTPRQMRRAEQELPVPKTAWQWECEAQWATEDQQVEALYTELGGEG